MLAASRRRAAASPRCVGEPGSVPRCDGAHECAGVHGLLGGRAGSGEYATTVGVLRFEAAFVTTESGTLPLLDTAATLIHSLPMSIPITVGSAHCARSELGPRALEGDIARASLLSVREARRYAGR